MYCKLSLRRYSKSFFASMKTFSVVFTVVLGVISSALASSAPPCPSDGSIDQYYPDSDCTKFWQCSNGVAYQKKCANDGTNWNPVKNTCDWAASAGCTGEGWSTTVAPPPTTTTARSTTTPGTTTTTENPEKTTTRHSSSTSMSTTTTTTTQKPTTTTVTTTRRPTTRTTTRRPTTRTTTRRPTTRTTTRTTTTTTRKPTKGPNHKDCEKWAWREWGGRPWWCRPPYYPPQE